MKLKVQFQYFEGCPNHEKLHKNLIEAIKGLEDKINLEEILVEDEETAKKVKFRGSPTLLINGEDIENLSAPEEPVLACRFYPKGIPSAEIIREKILQKLAKESY
ncbi:MAG: DF family (seleno)protein [Ignavibacteria bacterium]